jgi:hypothetical protein
MQKVSYATNMELPLLPDNVPALSRLQYAMSVTHSLTLIVIAIATGAIHRATNSIMIDSSKLKYFFILGRLLKLLL